MKRKTLKLKAQIDAKTCDHCKRWSGSSLGLIAGANEKQAALDKHRAGCTNPDGCRCHTVEGTYAGGSHPHTTIGGGRERKDY